MGFKSKDDNHAIPAKKDFWAEYGNVVLLQRSKSSYFCL